jgi:hypothetical protein
MNLQHYRSPAKDLTRLFLICWLVMSIVGSSLKAQEAADFFRQNCISCHTMGGGWLTGPDLKGVLTRKDLGWLVRFVLNPQAMMDQGDPYALKLRQEARDIIMPKISGRDGALAESLLRMINAESKLGKSQFAGLQVSDRPFTTRDIEQGRQLFTGVQHLANAGPPLLDTESDGRICRP